ncbi:hypothetical protein [Pseudonocardia sp. NPDC046786]|uniref:hypothetical protein n=1 Tax=Pseudonocardia sp. NPDC046786 TaxID=3155471 RepID=UPI00340DF386
MAIHPGTPARRSLPCSGCTTITTTSARNTGPTSQAAAYSPAAATTAAAAPTSRVTVRGSGASSGMVIF